jgi:hypothetical protein
MRQRSLPEQTNGTTKTWTSGALLTPRFALREGRRTHARSGAAASSNGAPVSMASEARRVAAAGGIDLGTELVRASGRARFLQRLANGRALQRLTRAGASERVT